MMSFSAGCNESLSTGDTLYLNERDKDEYCLSTKRSERLSNDLERLASMQRIKEGCIEFDKSVITQNEELRGRLVLSLEAGVSRLRTIHLSVEGTEFFKLATHSSDGSLIDYRTHSPCIQKVDTCSDNEEAIRATSPQEHSVYVVEKVVSLPWDDPEFEYCETLVVPFSMMLSTDMPSSSQLTEKGFDLSVRHVVSAAVYATHDLDQLPHTMPANHTIVFSCSKDIQLQEDIRVQPSWNPYARFCVFKPSLLFGSGRMQFKVGKGAICVRPGEVASLDLELSGIHRVYPVTAIVTCRHTLIVRKEPILTFDHGADLDGAEAPGNSRNGHETHQNNLWFKRSRDIEEIRAPLNIENPQDRQRVSFNIPFRVPSDLAPTTHGALIESYYELAVRLVYRKDFRIRSHVTQCEVARPLIIWPEGVCSYLPFEPSDGKKESPRLLVLKNVQLILDQ